MGYDWNFSFLRPYTAAFLRGTWITVELSVLSFMVGTLVGILFGILLRILPGRPLLLLLNDAVRALPVFVLLLFAYYFPYPQVFGIASPGSFACAVLAISVSQAAYTADLVRAAIEGVPRRAILGGQALGLKNGDILRFIVLPDLLRQTLPAQVAFFIGIVRITSIAAVVGCEEVVFVAREANGQNFRSLEAWIVVAAIYVVLVVPLTVALRRLEGSRWLKRRA